MKILLVADTHLGYDYPVQPRINRRRRGDDFFLNFQRMLDYAVEEKVDMVVHGGDLFFRSKVPQKIIDKAYGQLFDFADKGIPIIIVPGNHERSELPISFLTQHHNIHIFDEPKNFIFNIKSKTVSLCGFPFIENNVRDNFPDIVRNLLEGLQDIDLNLLCIHQSVAGSSVSGFTFYYGQDVVKIDDIPNEFDAVLCGHIHRRQVIWKSSPAKEIPVLYPGSIERTSFAEMDEEKGFYVLHYSDTDIGMILDKIEEVDLPSRPMEDIIITFYTEDEDELRNWLEVKLAQISQDSIIRIKYLDEVVRKLLTTEFLRSVVPKTMNISVSTLKKAYKIKI